MAKIFTDDEIHFLSANPNVREITPKRLSLKYEFRCQLYEAWSVGGRAAIRSLRKYLKKQKIEIALTPFEIKPPYVLKVAA